MKTPATSTTVVINGADIKAGSKPSRSNSKGKLAPAVAARIEMQSIETPAATATKGSPLNFQDQGTTTAASNKPSKTPAKASRATVRQGPKACKRLVLRPRITTVELWAPTFPPVPINKGIKAANCTTRCSTPCWEAITAEVPVLVMSNTNNHNTRLFATSNKLLWK